MVYLQRVSSLAKSAFCAFSLGPRGCIGRSLAYVEMMLTMAKVLWEFDLKRCEGDMTGSDSEGNYVVEDYFITKKHGPMIQFRPRVDV